MSILTSGRTEPCRDNIGGIKKLFLFPFVEYAHTLITQVRGKEITAFPATDVYEFDITRGSMSESVENNDGELSYNQNLSFVLNLPMKR